MQLKLEMDETDMIALRDLMEHGACPHAWALERVKGRLGAAMQSLPTLAAQETRTQPGESEAAGQDVRMVPRWMFDLMRDQVDDLAEIARLAKRALPKADEAVRLLRQGVDQPTYQDGVAAACARIREEANGCVGIASVGPPTEVRGVWLPVASVLDIIDRIAEEGT